MAKYYLPAYILKAGIDQNSFRALCSSDELARGVYMGEFCNEVYGDMVCLSTSQMFAVADKATCWWALPEGFYRTLGVLAGVNYDDFYWGEIDFLEAVGARLGFKG
jgi:hypothetical protein